MLNGARVMTDLLIDVGGIGFRVQVVVQQQLSMASVGLEVLHLPAVLSSWVLLSLQEDTQDAQISTDTSRS